MLAITGLRNAYRGPEVLRGVDLEAAPGQVIGLLGANGAGKTTLISIVAGLRSADAGRVRVAGLDALRNRRRVAAHIGLAPQELGVYPTLTVVANLTLFARLAALRGGEMRRRVADTAERLGLHDQLNRRAAELSGGQKRRLHTRAWARSRSATCWPRSASRSAGPTQPTRRLPAPGGGAGRLRVPAGRAVRARAAGNAGRFCPASVDSRYCRNR